MRLDQWETIKSCAAMQPQTDTPIALIVDSPWMPGYLKISMLDYLMDPQVWLNANLQIEREYPEIIFLPGFWAEMGMGAEPSGFGGKLSFYHDKTPVFHPMFTSVEQAQELSLPNPLSDGLMPLILRQYASLEQRINAEGQHIKVVAARGPLAVASHLVGVTNFLLGMKLDPDNTHRLLRLTTDTTRNWLEAQANVLKEVEGVMVLDDIAGFLSPVDYEQFAHPYLKETFAAFPAAIKFFHNDMDNPANFHRLVDLGVNIFNFTHLRPIDKVRQKVGSQVCLMGNIPPLDVLVSGTPEDVAASVQSILAAYPDRAGLILSAGGGTSPGTPAANIQALVCSAQRTRL